MNLFVLVASGLMAAAPANDRVAVPVALRMDSFSVTPAHLPPVVVTVRNLQQSPYEGVVRLKLPKGWTYKPAEQRVSLGPVETKRVRFTITRGRTRQSNRYPVEMVAIGSGTVVIREQEVVCASAPYFKPQIDGRVDEWDDAIPVTFTVGGKKTVISTYWNRRQFSMLVAVEEDNFVPFDNNARDKSFDAIQLAISPQDTETGSSPQDDATRYEFLIVGTGDGAGGRCFQLAQPGMKLAEAAEVRRPAGLEFDKAKVAVSRNEGITYYEFGIPFRSLKQIKPSEGREFFLSVLVHDPDGSGIRDWGAAAGLFSSERKPLAWSRWQGDRRPTKPPFDNKTPWGMCSSKY